MTVLEDFSTDDQIVLARTPTAIVMATAYAEQDGVFSIRKELKAGLQAAIDGSTAFPDNQIIQRLSLEMNSVNPEEVDEVKERAKTATDPEDLVEERNPTNSRPLALQLAAQSLAILEANATVEETVEFKYWLYSIADQVTLASKAGGFLGFGGTRVSPAEAQFLDELRTALDIPDDNVPSAGESNAKPDDDEAPVAAETSDEAPAEETEAARIARLDAASVRADEPIQHVRAERPEDVLAMDGIWTTDELIDSLSKLPVLLPVVLAETDAETARFRPAAREWSTVEVVGHLIDVEERALMRIALIQEQDNPELTGYDPDAMVADRGYQDQELQPLVDRLFELRVERLAALRALSPEQWARTGFVPGRGDTPLTAVTVHLCWHDTTHLAQIATNLAAAQG